MNVDVDERHVDDDDDVNDIENMSVDDMNVHVLGEDVSGEEKIDESDDSDEGHVQGGEVVQYGQGVIRRREDRSPDSSDGEGPRMEVAKRTRRNTGKEIVLSEDHTDERTWAPIETGMVLRADGTVMKSDAPEGAAPHEGQVHVSQPRSQWAVIIPGSHLGEVEGDAPHEGQVNVSPPPSQRITRSRGPPAIEHAHAISERILMINEIKEPVSFRQIFNRPDRPKWITACDSEYNSLIANGTWELVLLPKGRNAISCKWVFKIKYKSNGEVECYKCRT
ncbi:hypothetical protein LIPSTDRAFT_193131 [Lipomyces starkeyi NRRL Y-11557]|uniref:Reverse transcriptase Ty1/copia-type domain-containing protein n=1 Tax=Lipomyces starkeyi NRRL Y-11557 TaxID=675824 RepID=A0A1E3PW77_LIPST|nr:hypothetical protein LIPSTDRAFT_193131 [Lipomyces starkeyi NRRL Y-11557]